jgi:hypothetical protein
MGLPAEHCHEYCNRNWRIIRTSDAQRQKQEQAEERSLLPVGALSDGSLLSWFVFLTMTVSGKHYLQRYYGLWCFLYFVTPLQGFFNALVYFRRRLVLCWSGVAVKAKSWFSKAQSSESEKRAVSVQEQWAVEPNEDLVHANEETAEMKFEGNSSDNMQEELPENQPITTMSQQRSAFEQSLEETPQMRGNGKQQECDTTEEASLVGEERCKFYRLQANLREDAALTDIDQNLEPRIYRLQDDTTILAYVTDKGDAQGHGCEGQAAPEGPPSTASFFIVRLIALPQLGRFQTFSGGGVRDRRCFFRLKDQDRRRRR